MSKEEWLENLSDIRILNSDIRIFVYVRVLNLITHFFHSLLLFMFIVLSNKIQLVSYLKKTLMLLRHQTVSQRICS